MLYRSCTSATRCELIRPGSDCSPRDSLGLNVQNSRNSLPAWASLFWQGLESFVFCKLPETCVVYNKATGTAGSDVNMELLGKVNGSSVCNSSGPFLD